MPTYHKPIKTPSVHATSHKPLMHDHWLRVGSDNIIAGSVGIEHLSPMLQTVLTGSEVFCGAWDPDVEYRTSSGGEYITVSHIGVKWYLKTTYSKGDEPLPMSTVWGVMNGSDSMKIEFYNSSNFIVHVNHVDTIVRAYIMLGDYDITEQMLSRGSGTEYPTRVEWLRDSGNAEQDKGWVPTFVSEEGEDVTSSALATAKAIVRLRYDGVGYHDLGYDWCTRRTCTYLLKITFPDGAQLTRPLQVGMRRYKDYY